MKKLICLMSVLILLVSLAACGAAQTAATDPTPATDPTQPVTEPQVEKVKLYLPLSEVSAEGTFTWEYETVDPTGSGTIMCRENWAYGEDIPVSTARHTASPYKMRVEQLNQENQVERTYITEYDETGKIIRVTDRIPLENGDYSDVITEYTYNKEGIPSGEVCYEQQQENGVLSEKEKVLEIAYTVEKTDEGWMDTKEAEELVEYYNDKGWLVKWTQGSGEEQLTVTNTHNEAGAVVETTSQAGDTEPSVATREYSAVSVPVEVAEQYPMFSRG